MICACKLCYTFSVMEENKNGLLELSEVLIPWFNENQRRTPWREDPTPYRVWVSEIMLQQTRIDTVIPYYERFIRELPDVRALAACPEDRLYKLFEGLGYYSRVRHMQEAAVKLLDEYHGEFPEEEQELLKLPGIGSYTAGAVLSIAMEQPCPVVDGNVLRVYSRIFGDARDIAEERTKRAFQENLRSFLVSSSVSPSAFNQGLMELGETVCLPNGEPRCSACPAAGLCIARREERISVLPVKTQKLKRRTEKKTVFLVFEKKKLLIGKREEKGLLQGLYALPLKEGFLTGEEAKSFLFSLGITDCSLSLEEEKKHVFTHVTWEMRAYRVGSLQSDPEALKKAGLFFVSYAEMEVDYALPGAFKKWEFWDEK